MIQKKLIFFISIVTVLILTLVGCQKAATSQQSANSQRGANASQTRQQIQTELTSLVKNGTITQSQADQIETALSGMNSMGRKRSSSGGQNGSNSSWRRNGNQQNGNSRNSFSSGTGSSQKFNPLSKLVQDGTITQSQADAVMKAIFPDRFSSGGSSQGN